jgi:hypothetical protein
VAPRWRPTRLGGGRRKGLRKQDLVGGQPYIPWRAGQAFERAFDAEQARLRAALRTLPGGFPADPRKRAGNFPSACRRLGPSTRSDGPANPA